MLPQLRGTNEWDHVHLEHGLRVACASQGPAAEEHGARLSRRKRPFVVGEIARISQSVAVVTLAVVRRPHRCPSPNQATTLPGSTVAEGSPKIGRTSIAKRSHSCASPQSASCSENSAIPSDLSGQTLRNDGWLHEVAETCVPLATSVTCRIEAPVRAVPAKLMRGALPVLVKNLMLDRLVRVERRFRNVKRRPTLTPGSTKFNALTLLSFLVATPGSQSAPMGPHPLANFQSYFKKVTRPRVGSTFGADSRPSTAVISISPPAPGWQEFSSRKQQWSEQPCVRPVSAVHVTAGHNALRGSGPGQFHAFDNAVAQVGCPDRRIDRLCITCCSPFRHVTPDARRDLFYAASATGSL
jgi:hypothetical protein